MVTENVSYNSQTKAAAYYDEFAVPQEESAFAAFNRNSNNGRGFVRSDNKDPRMTIPLAQADGMWCKATHERCRCRGIQHQSQKGKARHRHHQQQQQQQQESFDYETAVASSRIAIREQQQQRLGILSQRYNRAADGIHVLDGINKCLELVALRRRTAACRVQHATHNNSRRVSQQESSAHHHHDDAIIARPNITSRELPQHGKEDNEGNQDEENEERFQPRQHFYAVSPPGTAWNGGSRWGGDERERRAGGGGAPSFTVGGNISRRGRDHSGEDGFGFTRGNPGQQTFGARRAELLRRILAAAMRYSVQSVVEQQLMPSKGSQTKHASGKQPSVLRSSVCL